MVEYTGKAANWVELYKWPLNDQPKPDVAEDLYIGFPLSKAPEVVVPVPIVIVCAFAINDERTIIIAIPQREKLLQRVRPGDEPVVVSNTAKSLGFGGN
jgi:hypothetical protein